MEGEKSYVTMCRKKCAVCDKEYDTGELMLHRRLKNTFEKYTTVGLGICPEHQKKGFVVLVGASEVTEDHAHRTGEVIHIKRDVFCKLFNKPCPKEFAFIDPEAVQKLKEMMLDANKN